MVSMLHGVNFSAQLGVRTTHGRPFLFRSIQRIYIGRQRRVFDHTRPHNQSNNRTLVGNNHWHENCEHNPSLAPIISDFVSKKLVGSATLVEVLDNT